MGGFRVKIDKVPEVVVSSLGLWYLVVRLGLNSMDKIRELNRILDKENGDVVSNQIPISFVGVEFHGKPTNVTDGVGTSFTALDRGETKENRSVP